MRLAPIRCAVCGIVLAPRHLKNQYGERYCVGHQNLDTCVWCGRIGGLRRKASCMRCEECDRASIDRPEQLASLRGDVLETVATWIGQHRLGEIPAAMEGGMIVTAGARRVGRAQSITTGGRADLKIVLTPGMPRELAGAVLMHEYGHAMFAIEPATLLSWSERRRPRPAEEEGACEVLAAEWLATQPGERAGLERRRIEQNPDPLYGGGYRTMAARRATSTSMTEWIRADIFGGQKTRVKVHGAR